MQALLALPGITGHSMQARELADMTGKGKELRLRIKDLTEGLEKEQSATSLATKELQVSLPLTVKLTEAAQRLCHFVYRLGSRYSGPPNFAGRESWGFGKQ